MIIKRENLGKIARFVAAFLSLFITFSVIAYLIHLIQAGQELGFEILGFKLVLYVFIGLYLIYGTFALFKNIRKSFPITILVIFSLMNFEIGFRYINQVGNPSLTNQLSTILFYLLPIILIVISLKKEKSDIDAGSMFRKWFGGNAASPVKLKVFFWVHFIYAVLFTVVSAGFLSLPMPTKQDDELLVYSQKAGSSAIAFGLLLLSYFLVCFLIIFLLKDKRSGESSVDRAKKIFGEDLKHLTEDKLPNS